MDDADVLAEAHRLTDLVLCAVRRRHGQHRIPVIGSASWWAATDEMRVATLLVLAEHWLLRSPAALAVDQLKAAAVALSEGHDWTAASKRPSHAELQRRRGEAA